MRILLVEDSERLSAPLTKGQGAAGFEVDVVMTAAEAYEATVGTGYSAVVLDLGLPDEDGLTVLREIRQRGISTPILILTARSSLKDRVKGLETGADDYLGKPFALEELVARLQALLRRPENLLGSVLNVGNVTLDTQGRQIAVLGQVLSFSAREIVILELLMRRSGRVVSKKLLEDQLFGSGSDVGSNAVEVYIHRIRKQLAGIRADAQIHTVRGVGYMITQGK
jgi:two-component system response regulator TctD